MQSVISITNLSEMANTWKNYVKYYEIADLTILFTLTFKIRV